MHSFISGIQQVGIGVSHAENYFAWFRKCFGFDVPVFDDCAQAALMTRYTGGEVHSRRAILAMNLSGGGGAEIWQFTSREGQAAMQDEQWSCPGISAVLIKVPNLARFQENVQSKLPDTHIIANSEGVWVLDPYGNWFLVREKKDFFSVQKHPGGGVLGAIISVSDLEKALHFYTHLLGVSDLQVKQEELSNIPNAHGQVFKRAIIEFTNPSLGAFSQLLGNNVIELIQPLNVPSGEHKYHHRFWGDLGFIHLCFDVLNLGGLKDHLAIKEFRLTVDSGSTFDMGESGGRFAYVEDPDGTLIELVETHKVPILKKWGWYLDLRKRKKEKPLPTWMIKAMGLSRVK